MTDLTKITTPFGLLDEDTQKALRECGGPWECYHTNGWEDLVDPNWFPNVAYRQKPQPPKPREWWINAEGRGVIRFDPAELDMPPPWVRVREVL